MENKIRVDVAANKLKASKNKNYLSSTFKSLILKRFRQIQYGHIELVDDNKVYSFGNPDSESTVKVEEPLITKLFLRSCLPIYFILCHF